jgi:hypothetical protein
LTWDGQPADWIVDQLECTLSDWVNIPKLVGVYWGTFPGFHEHRPVVELFEIPEVLMVCPATPDRGSPWHRIEQLARGRLQRTRAPEGFTLEMAVAEVLKKHPELYDEYLKSPSHYSQVINCMPTAYLRPQIRKALRQLRANVQQVLRHMESDRQFRQYLSAKCPLEKARSIDEEHFVWAVRFQCLGHTYAGIAASRGIDWIEPYSHLNDAKLAAAGSAVPAIATGIREILQFIELTPRGGDKIGRPKRK